MASDLERLVSINTKLERARRHFNDLVSETRQYLAATPYVVKSQLDPQTRRRVYYLSSVQQTPPSLSAILGDTIHNLRCTLDHLAYQLVWVGSGSRPGSHVYFPIADDASRYSQQRDRQLEGALQQAVQTIDAMKPYRGGDDVLWRLHRLNNIDKHRTLVTAGSAYQSFNIGAHMLRELRKVQERNPAFAGKALPSLDLFARPADRLFPLEVGDALFIDAPDAPENAALQFRFEVAVGENDVIMGEPLLEMVDTMLERVSEVVAAMTPLLQGDV